MLKQKIRLAERIWKGKASRSYRVCSPFASRWWWWSFRRQDHHLFHHHQLYAFMSRDAICRQCFWPMNLFVTEEERGESRDFTTVWVFMRRSDRACNLSSLKLFSFSKIGSRDDPLDFTNKSSFLKNHPHHLLWLWHHSFSSHFSWSLCSCRLRPLPIFN